MAKERKYETATCECGGTRKRGAPRCPACEKERRAAKRAAKQLARSVSTYKPCPEPLRTRILARALEAFARWTTLEPTKDGRLVEQNECRDYGEAKQFEGLPAVSTPYLSFEGARRKADAVEVLINAIERKLRLNPRSAKISVAVVESRRLGEPVYCLRESDFWAVVSEWANEDEPFQ